MSTPFPHKHIRFGEFEFDPERFALYCGGELLRVEKKALEVLAVLIRSPRKLTTTQEIIDTVWPDNPHGITPTHVAQNISKLRKAFEERMPGSTFIETVKGSGFVFAYDVLLRISGEMKIPILPSTETTDGQNVEHSYRKWLFIGVPVIFVVALAAIAWMWHGESAESEIKRVVEESQRFESLVLYKNPTAFKEEDLDKYWLSDQDANSNFDRRRIRDSVLKLVSDGRHYGDETKNEQFEFQSVEINSDGDFAAVRTLEEWFVSAYFDDGTLQKIRTIGPYFVDYTVRKVDGRWLIEKSTTARVNRPIPRLAHIDTISEAVAGKQFFVRITGQDIEPETVSLEITGPGCPESRVCKVPNSALRDHSKMSDSMLDNVPLTLASGEFKIAIRNGDSRTSESFPLTVR